MMINGGSQLFWRLSRATTVVRVPVFDSGLLFPSGAVLSGWGAPCLEQNVGKELEGGGGISAISRNGQ